MFTCRHSKPLAVSAMLLLVVAGAGGCSTSGVASASTCDTPGVTADQVNLGVLYPDTGAVASAFGAVRSGIDARLGVVNSTGGVHGRKITYEWRDDQGAAATNETAARDLVDGRRVFGIIEATLAASGSAQYLADRDIPVTGLAAEQVWSKYENMFAFSYVSAAPTDTYGQFVRSQGGSRAVVLQTALSTGVSNASARYARSLDGAGVQVLDTLNYTPGADSPLTVAQRIAALDPDTIISVIQPDALVAVLDTLRAAGRSPKVILSASGYDRRLLRTYGPRVAGLVVPVFYRPFESGGPAIAAYTTAMTRYSPQIDAPEQDLAVTSYIEADMFIRGLELAGDCPTRQGFITALRSVTRYDAGGLISPINIKTGLGKPTTCYSFVQANPRGTAFDVVAPDLCGKELAP
ncbi:ABC transporter substrate-binding protein [Frankia sp. QA3]|uniref:ABC transporter substrate-binding protein n=1 Tax=Frankia sp. QA3 TaxID=710111 RepID=UPI000269C0FF|nr:ABC-type branched-chain amino acid transport system, periplasmic component [Frankia sp. QA3]